MPQHRLSALLIASLCAGGIPAARAQASLPQTIVVTGSLREAALLEAPYAITSIAAAELRSRTPRVKPIMRPSTLPSVSST